MNAPTSIPPLTVIIQAGGRGSRLRHHTWNKPKCLVSIRGKPLLYHAFEHFKDAEFVVIGDYLFDQITRYMEVNPVPRPCRLVKATGKGTLSGLSEALAGIGDDSPVLLMWGDIIVRDLPALNSLREPTVFTTSAFACRWSVGADGVMREKPSAQAGIPGIFYFPRAIWIKDLPEQGEFVKWFAANKSGYGFCAANEIEELGDFSRVESENERAGFCRFFNQVEIGEETVIKTVIDPQFADVHNNERAWYRQVADIGFRRIPRVLDYSPLTLERLPGQHLFEIQDLTPREQRAVLSDYLDALTDLHDKGSQPADPQQVRAVYMDKTLARIQSVEHLIPYASQRHMAINGLKCRNFFHEDFRGIFADLLPRLMPQRFTPIHGDPTFSNAIIDRNLRVKFIDPRGAFDRPGIWGDPTYDFAKVYYSAVGGYDAFNRRRFKLFVDAETVEVLQEDPAYASTARVLFDEYFGADIGQIRLVHALIWFSLAGYVRDDIDSIIGAYSLGNFWLEKALKDLEGD